MRLLAGVKLTIGYSSVCLCGIIRIHVNRTTETAGTNVMKS